MPAVKPFFVIIRAIEMILQTNQHIQTYKKHLQYT